MMENPATGRVADMNDPSCGRAVCRVSSSGPAPELIRDADAKDYARL